MERIGRTGAGERWMRGEHVGGSVVAVSRAAVWVALAFASALMLLALGPAAARADGGTGITIEPSPDGVYAIGSYLTATFDTDGALSGNTPLSVSFVSSTSATVNYSKYTILSAAGTTYTASIFIPDLAPGQYILVIEGPEINGSELTSSPFNVAAPTPTPTPLPLHTSVPLGTQAHVVPPGPGAPGGAIAAAAAGTLLAVSLALLVVPPLRRRGNGKGKEQGNLPPR